MGSGRHEDQVDQRFDQGTPEWTKEKEGCGGPGVSLASYGSYDLWEEKMESSSGRMGRCWESILGLTCLRPTGLS